MTQIQVGTQMFDTDEIDEADVAAKATEQILAAHKVVNDAIGCGQYPVFTPANDRRQVVGAEADDHALELTLVLGQLLGGVLAALSAQIREAGGCGDPQCVACSGAATADEPIDGDTTIADLESRADFGEAVEEQGE